LQIRKCFALTVICMASFSVGSTSTMTKEQYDRYQAEKAAMAPLDGTWEATLSSRSPYDDVKIPEWTVRIIVVGRTASARMKHIQTNEVIQLGADASWVGGKEVVSFKRAITEGNYRGKLEVTFLRLDNDSAWVSVSLWHPPPTVAGKLQVISGWSGNSKRQSTR
jgi:hypothetical protein